MRDELIATGIVQNTPEFCRSWLGRSEGYIRVLRYHNTEPSVETLSICASKLGYYGARLAKFTMFRAKTPVRTPIRALL